MMDEYEFGPNISKVEFVRMNLSDDDGQKQFADYNKLCIDKGFEGIMVKPMDGPYECKRSSLWLKVKPFIEVSTDNQWSLRFPRFLRFRGFEPGEKL